MVLSFWFRKPTKSMFSNAIVSFLFLEWKYTKCIFLSMWMCCIKWIFFLSSHSFRKKSWSQLHAWIKWLWFRLFPRTFSIPAKFIFSSVPQALAFEERLPVHCTVLFLSSVLPFEHYSVACGTISFVRIAKKNQFIVKNPSRQRATSNASNLVLMEIRVINWFLFENK